MRAKLEPGPVMSPSPAGVEVWLTLSAFAVGGGWILSALGQLNAGGYAVVFIVAAGVCWGLRARRPGGSSAIKRVARFRHPLPLLFLVLAGCALIGGLIYAPSNWDAQTYRVPRVMHWLTAETWHWIPSGTSRVNVRAAGFEWLMAPLIAWTKSDRPLFVLNFISLLLLPGLVFSLFRRLGVRPQVAWYWMWLLPAGYGYILQAGSIGNDSFAVVYALAAIDFALRGEQSRRFRDFVFSALAAGLLTGAKASNLPLGLPWLVAALPMLLYWLRRRPTGATAALAAAAMISFLPMAVVNRSHCGDWFGTSLEAKHMPNVVAKNPFVGIFGNAYALVVHNLTPPFFPFAGWYRANAADFFPKSLLQGFKENLNYLDYFSMWELPGEDVCGVGFGSVILLLSALGIMVFRRNGFSLSPSRTMAAWRQIAFGAACFAAAVVVMAQAGCPCTRLLLPFYPLLFGSLLMFEGHRTIVRQRWWRVMSVAVMILAILVLVATPPRPLLPAQTVTRKLSQRWPHNALWTRAYRVYSVYRVRSDCLREVRDALPRSLSVIGLATSGDDMEVSLWRPFFRRQVVHIFPEDTPEKLHQRGVDYVVLSENGLQLWYQATIHEWCDRYGAQLLREFLLPMRASLADQKWYIAKIKSRP